MKDSKEKEHRISNLKGMINNIKNEELPQEAEADVFDYEYDDEIEEDSELINYLNEDKINFDDYEINDEFIYHPGDEKNYAIDLEENPIDENFIIKTEITDNISEEIVDETYEPDEFSDFIEEMESFDNFVNAKVGKTSVLAIISSIIGVLLIALSAYIFSSGSDRIIDNVVSGETNVFAVIVLIFGLLLLIYGVYNIFSIKNPFENITNSIDSIEKEETKKEKKVLSKIDENQQKIIPKSNIPLDKESYKIGEFNMDDLKYRLKKPTSSTKKMPVDDLENIPPAKEKSDYKKGLTSEEIEELEYKQAVLDNESIDDIFAGVEDIDEMPIIGIDSKNNKKD